MDWIKLRILKFALFILDLISNTTNQASLFTLYSLLILSSSVFSYITIYSTYVPIVQQTKPVYFQFDSKCEFNCQNPVANVNFNDVRSKLYLARGQSYKFIIELAMPESKTNREQGMFMINLKLESHGKILSDISRPAILKHRTFVTRVLKALVLSPLLLVNYKNEMQTLKVQLIDNYIEGAEFTFKKMDKAVIELVARDLQVYSADLHIIANLSGLSYYMYYWPISSAILGISTIVSFMSMISVYSNSNDPSARL